jgi:hypothetical protein
MKTNVIVAVLAATVVGFFLGWLIFGILLGPFYNSHMTVYQGLMKDPPDLWTFIIGSLTNALLFTYIFYGLANIRTLIQGAISGVIITFLVVAGFDLYFYGSMNLMDGTVLIADVVVNSIFGGIMGGFIAWILGMGKKA